MALPPDPNLNKLMDSYSYQKGWCWATIDVYRIDPSHPPAPYIYPRWSVPFGDLPFDMRMPL